MSKEIRILHLEDSQSDAMLVEWALKKSNLRYELLLVTNKNDFRAALHDFNPDIIISDHSLPSFSSIEALQMLKDAGKSIPFVLITGTVSEEFAVSIIKQGATDYLLKDRLQRLPEAIQSAIRSWNAEKERLKYFETVTKNENKFRALIENISDGIILVNEDGALIYQSPSEERISGYRNDEIAGRTIFDFIYPADLPKAEEFFQAVYANPGSTRSQQYRILHKTGQPVWVESTITNKLADPHINAIIINYRDITERKRSEEEALRLIEDLKKKNNDLRQFAYIVSHNLRAPIAKIQGLSTMLMDSVPAEDTHDLYEYITNEVNNLDQVVTDINAIITAGESENLEKEYVHFETIYSHVMQTMEHELKTCNASVIRNFSEAPGIFSVKSYIHSIIYNLLSNAVKYRSETVPLQIELSTLQIPGFICLNVKDNGSGIDMNKHKHHIFGLYKRFHSQAIEGKGVGLNMVKTQVESLGGRIEVESAPGIGSVFSVYFKSQESPVQ